MVGDGAVELATDDAIDAAVVDQGEDVAESNDALVTDAEMLDVDDRLVRLDNDSNEVAESVVLVTLTLVVPIGVVIEVDKRDAVNDATPVDVDGADNVDTVKTVVESELLESIAALESVGAAGAVKDSGVADGVD